MLKAPRPSAITCTLAAILASFVLWTQSASGFKIPGHNFVLSTALANLSPEVLADIEGSVLSGVGNSGSDLWQTSDFRHFDSAASPTGVCLLANRAWSTFTSHIVYAMQNGYVASARWSFGGLTHSVQDFYSHSNWLELGRRDLAPIWPVCTGLGLPANLQTGYFLPTLGALISGCPTDAQGRPAPPPPFTDCHLTLNKDDQVGHGGDQLPEGGTYHQAALELAVADTRSVYQLVRTHLTTTITAATHNLSGACLADVLFGTGGMPVRLEPPIPCLDLSGVWRNFGSNPPGVGGLLWTLTQVSQLDLSGVVQTFTCGPVLFSVHRSGLGDPEFQGSMSSCPLGPSSVCPPVLSLPLKLTMLPYGKLRADLTAIEVEETSSACREVGRTSQEISLQR